MKIFVEKSIFSNELKLFQGIFEKKTLMEILQNIKMTAYENGVLELTATDLEIGLQSSVKVDVKEPGSVTVNGRDFYDLISRMPEGQVEISENNDLQIAINNAAKTSKYKLMGMQSSEYPALPESDFSESIHLDSSRLQSMINKTHYIISPEMKFNLGGALLSLGAERWEMAATDGHRLAFCAVDEAGNSTEPLEFIVSRKTLLELLKVGEDLDIDFAYDKNNLFFRAGNRVLSARIIDQKFPNYRAVIPEATRFKARLDTEALLTTLRRVLVFKTRNNGVFFRFGKDKLILERSTPEKGEAHEELGIEYAGEEVKAAFNGNFVLDFLTHVESEQIEIGMNDGENSFVFRPVSSQGVDFIYVVMPLNL
ncbi:MAG: DNA polymerase III subunit beta [Acidobacteriota bacterium]|jgi:DNA polymerase-3 subunit beta|nr:DNA polymerase III subunit beta [Acidobacteriota bacterium]